MVHEEKYLIRANESNNINMLNVEQESDFNYKITEVGSKNLRILPNFEASYRLSSHQQKEIYETKQRASSGSTSEPFARLLFSQTIGACFAVGDDREFVINAMHQAAIALKPQDEIEGMLIHRLIILHNQYMHFMGSVAFPDQSSQIIETNLNRATKLMRLYNETLDTLNRHRRKGEQKVTVQHVNVNNGGQAVVAGELTQTRGERLNDKK